jgi:hypothetical protein
VREREREREREKERERREKEYVFMFECVWQNMCLYGTLYYIFAIFDIHYFLHTHLHMFTLTYTHTLAHLFTHALTHSHTHTLTQSHTHILSQNRALTDNNHMAMLASPQNSIAIIDFLGCPKDTELKCTLM